MSLPVISAVYHKVSLPSTGKLVKFRPFKIREQKALLVAFESEQEEQVFSAMKQCVNNCLHPDANITIDSLTVTDLQFLFLKMRCESVGEIANPAAMCGECGKATTIKIDLRDIETVGNPTKFKMIDITDNIKVKLVPPTIRLLDHIENIAEIESPENAMKMVALCIEEIYVGEDVTKAKDETIEDMVAWVDDLDSGVNDKFNEFFSSLPRMEHTHEFNCKHCGAEQKAVLTSITDFFVSVYVMNQ